MIHLIKITLFLITNAVGFYTIPTLINLAVMTDRFPNVPDAQFEAFQFLIITMAIPVWGAAALVSIGYFFSPASMRPWLILAPIYVPAIYGLSVITYFHFV